MSKFNRSGKTAAGAPAWNEAGGRACTLTPELELAGIAWTSFCADEFYAGAEETEARLARLAEQVDPRFVADVALIARRHIGLRSISHVLTGLLSSDKRAVGTSWLRPWVCRMIRRPDDMLEILAWLGLRGRKPGNALLRGFADYLENCPEHILAKWNKGQGRKLRDIANIAHPRSTPALARLVTNTLPSPVSGETVNWKAAHEIERAFEAGQLGYLSLLYHLRSLIEVTPDLAPRVCKRLMDVREIRSAGVLPYQYLRAYEVAVEERFAEYARAIQTAIRLSLDTVPQLNGRTAVILDRSGSMLGRPWENAALLASGWTLDNAADLYLFHHEAWRETYDPTLHPLQLFEQLSRHEWGGTDLTAAFVRLGDKPYEYVFVFSDEEHWIGESWGQEALEDYRRRSGANPMVFILNPATYGTTQFHGPRVISTHGVSYKVFQIANWFAANGRDVTRLARQLATVYAA